MDQAKTTLPRYSLNSKINDNADNCGKDNKNHFVLMFLAALVEAEVFKKIPAVERPSRALDPNILEAINRHIVQLHTLSENDMISTLGETTGYFALKKMKQKMLEDPVGRQIIEEEPEINTSTLSIDYLWSLPDDTFGKKYYNFLSKNGFSPDARLPVHFVDDPCELKYVMLRYRQTHDLFQSVLGMPLHMLGEVAVKWVEAIQTGLPMCALGAFFGPLRLGSVNRQQYVSIYLPWAIRCGTNSNFLMAIYLVLQPDIYLMEEETAEGSDDSEKEEVEYHR
ncbi:LOW QUALITY PROTEIN: ubiquinone biosynthesis protein COQ4 homolog, mitochondrial-like [Mytilus galloprovincialis]|uniref:LOW QUALITY PROTEIN: ubiquinone biosynthesis protein COQ4 homolog, mitochondrial-like n=1 Tax=Mytilus galloprovincialis TaxID=29158 RepID=UPI003F7CB584